MHAHVCSCICTCRICTCMDACSLISLSLDHGSHSFILMDISPFGLSLQLPRVRLVHFGRPCLSSTFHTPGMPSSCPPPGAAASLPYPARLEPSTGASHRGSASHIEMHFSLAQQLLVGGLSRSPSLLTLPALASHSPSVLPSFYAPPSKAFQPLLLTGRSILCTSFVLSISSYFSSSFTDLC